MASQGQQPHTVAHVLGEMTWLLSQSPLYKQMTIGMLESTIMPAILLQQFRIFYNESTPVGFAVWAFVSDAVDAALTEKMEHHTPFELQLADWKSGSTIWLMELVAPAATPENKLTSVLLKQLKATAFKNAPFKYRVSHLIPAENDLVRMNVEEMGHA